MEWNMDIVKAEFVVSNATCFYRAVECRKIVIDQYADEQ